MKKLIDENGRLFGFVSVIDVLVVAVALVLAAALYTRNTALPIASAADPMDDITYQVVISNMPAGRLESLREGDYLYDKETFNLVGKIVGIEVEDCVISMLKADGTYVMAPIDSRYNVTLTVEAKAMKDERGHFYINRNTLVAVGWSMDFYTKTSLFGGTILEIA